MRGLWVRCDRGVAFEAARRRRTLAEVALLLGLTRIGVLLVAAGSVLVLAFGLWLVRLERIGYGAGWVDAALGLFAAMVAGVEGAELRRLLNDRLTLAINYLLAVLVLAIVALMVF